MDDAILDMTLDDVGLLSAYQFVKIDIYPIGGTPLEVYDPVTFKITYQRPAYLAFKSFLMIMLSIFTIGVFICYSYEIITFLMKKRREHGFYSLRFLLPEQVCKQDNQLLKPYQFVLIQNVILCTVV